MPKVKIRKRRTKYRLRSTKAGRRKVAKRAGKFVLGAMEAATVVKDFVSSMRGVNERARETRRRGAGSFLRDVVESL